MSGMTITRAGIVIWGAAGASICLTPDTAPAWLRISLAGIVSAPIAALLLWPFLLVRGLREAPSPELAGSDEVRETRIQVLDGDR